MGLALSITKWTGATLFLIGFIVFLVFQKHLQLIHVTSKTPKKEVYVFKFVMIVIVLLAALLYTYMVGLWIYKRIRNRELPDITQVIAFLMVLLFDIGLLIVLIELISPKNIFPDKVSKHYYRITIAALFFGIMFWIGVMEDFQDDGNGGD